MAASIRIAALGVAGAMLAGGCGEGESDLPPRVRPAPPIDAKAVPPPRESVRVIRRWADALRRGDVRAAARLFALPSIVQLEPGGPELRITKRRHAVAFQRVLPCGATVVRADREGRYVTVLLRLTQRPGDRCDAPGTTVRTAFLVRDGRIAEWRRERV
jgi:limonene-1,2-epoxide hydrolase